MATMLDELNRLATALAEIRQQVRTLVEEQQELRRCVAGARAEARTRLASLEARLSCVEAHVLTRRSRRRLPNRRLSPGRRPSPSRPAACRPSRTCDARRAPA